ncbi:MAG: hypothetical protein ACRBB5_08905 [Nitrosopumilus sp.]
MIAISVIPTSIIIRKKDQSGVSLQSTDAILKNFLYGNQEQGKNTDSKHAKHN